MTTAGPSRLLSHNTHTQHTQQSLTATGCQSVVVLFCFTAISQQLVILFSIFSSLLCLSLLDDKGISLTCFDGAYDRQYFSLTMIRNISEDDGIGTRSPATVTGCRPAARPRINVLTEISDASDKTAWRLTQKTLLDHPDPICENGTSSNSSSYSCKAFRAVLLCLCLMSVLVIQGAFLNFWIISFNEGKSEWYFLFFADFVILVTFGFSITFAWRYYEQIRKEHMFSYAGHHGDHHDPHDAQIEATKRIGAGLFKFTFPKPMGMLPLIYLCWILYAVTLVVKLYIMYFLDIPQQMVQSNFRTPKEYILIALAGSVGVFYFWVEAHWLIGDEVHKRLSKPSVDDLIGHTMFEIFDSLSFLDLITPDDKNEVLVDQKVITTTMKTIILLLASVNFLIPFLGLYRLSRTYFGEKTNGMIRVVDELTGQPTTRGLGISITYHIIRLVAVNIPFLIIRFYLSAEPTKELSMFVVKNALGILVAIRNLVPEVNQWIRVNKFKRNVRLSRLTERLSQPRNIEVNAGGDHAGWEMPVMYSNNSSIIKRKQEKQLEQQTRRPPVLQEMSEQRHLSIDSDEINAEEANPATDTTRTSSSSTDNIENSELNGQHKF